MAWYEKQRVLVPIDFSQKSFEALDVAHEFVKDPSQLYLIYVVRPMRPTDLDMIWETLTEEQRIHLQGLRLGTGDTTAGKEGEKRIQIHAKALRDHLDEAYEQVNVNITFGDPGEEIAKHADEMGVELIVMPSHGRRGVKHLLLGSVAERVLRYAHCPVLVLR